MTVRRACPEDVPVLVQLVRELAAYEKAEHEALMTPEQLQKMSDEMGKLMAQRAKTNQAPPPLPFSSKPPEEQRQILVEDLLRAYPSLTREEATELIDGVF